MGNKALVGFIISVLLILVALLFLADTDVPKKKWGPQAMVEVYAKQQRSLRRGLSSDPVREEREKKLKQSKDEIEEEEENDEEVGNKAKIDFQTWMDKILELKECYKSQTCSFSSDDPRSYDLSVGQALASTIHDIYMNYSRRPFEVDADEAFAIAQEEGMEVADGHVQSEALRLYEFIAPTRKSFDLLTEGLALSSHDSTLFEQALDQFERYVDSPIEAEMSAFVQDQIENGGQFTRKLLAEKVSRLLTRESLPGYKDLLQRLPASSEEKKALKSAIEEFELSQNGG